MDPVTVAAGIGAVSSAFGASKANAANKSMARSQMRFQREMSNTAHQRQVEDMKLAGLNPMLSGMGGSGASSPSGATAQMQNEMPDVSSVVSTALETKRLKKDIKLAEQQIVNQKAQARKTNTETTLLKANVPVAELKNQAGRMAQKFIENVSSSAKNSDTLGIKAAKKIKNTYKNASSIKKARKDYVKKNPNKKGLSPLDFKLPF